MFSTLMSVANDKVSTSRDEFDSPVPHRLRNLIDRLLAKDSRKRPASAGEVIQAIRDSADAPTSPIPSNHDWKRSGAAIAGALAACLIFFLGFGIYQATNKGTLVIEADPSVELQIKNETVTVKDPMSGKSYTVRIGSQPLPSGVYQLEVADKSSGLTFSSQVVTIRRNEKELVKISLRSDVGNDADDTAATPQQQEPDVPFDLANLPALNAEDTARALGLRSRKSLSPFARVSHARALYRRSQLVARADPSCQSRRSRDNVQGRTANCPIGSGRLHPHSR